MTRHLMLKNFFKFFKITSKDVVACYWPINNELDTRPLISFLSLKKIKIALPIIEKKKCFLKHGKLMRNYTIQNINSMNL